MVYQRHWLLSWGGSLAGGKEVWANNVRFQNRVSGSVDVISDSRMESMLDDFVTDIRAFHTSADVFISRNAKVEWVKFNEIGPDGRYKDQTKTHARFLTSAPGALQIMAGASTAGAPTYQSVCITTTTDVQRGPGSKGRLFLPQCAVPLQETGDILPGNATLIANRAAAFFTALGDESGIDVEAIAPAVVSNVGNPGPMNRITGVKVGNIPDVISRRKNALLETYVKATVSTA